MLELLRAIRGAVANYLEFEDLEEYQSGFFNVHSEEWLGICETIEKRIGHQIKQQWRKRLPGQEVVLLL